VGDDAEKPKTTVKGAKKTKEKSSSTEPSGEIVRIRQTVNTALRIGKGSLMIQKHDSGNEKTTKKSAKDKNRLARM
jgi:hypothetical protein